MSSLKAPAVNEDTGNSLHEQSDYVFGAQEDGELSTVNTSHGEIATLITIATVGILANASVIIVIFVLRDLRRASNAFVCHHCILDLIKSCYCLPFAQTMSQIQPVTLCNILGSSYIVFVTTTAFNMLAMVMNEAYMFSDLTLGITDSRNFCCVSFGVFIIWFGSIIMNLGVAFIPGNPGLDRKFDYCVFVYGITQNYILHILWIVLVTMAIGMTIMYLKKLHTDIKKSSYYRLSTLIRATVNIDTDIQTRSQQKAHEVRERHHIKFIQKVTRKKLMLLVTVVISFILFWYPMFLLTVADPSFRVPALVYKALTFYAWSNPALTPFLFMLYLKMTCFCKEARSCDHEGKGSGRIAECDRNMWRPV